MNLRDAVRKWLGIDQLATKEDAQAIIAAIESAKPVAYIPVPRGPRQEYQAPEMSWDTVQAIALHALETEDERTH